MPSQSDRFMCFSYKIYNEYQYSVVTELADGKFVSNRFSLS